MNDLVPQPNLNKTKKSVKFEYFAPQAKQVLLGGTFNNWEPSKTPMKKDGEGRWKVSFELPLGRYEYRYLVDDDWQNDQKSVECVPNAFGTWNCAFEVK